MFTLIKKVKCLVFNDKQYYLCLPQMMETKGSSKSYIERVMNSYDIVTLQNGSRLEPCILYIDNNPDRKDYIEKLKNLIPDEVIEAQGTIIEGDRKEKNIWIRKDYGLQCKAFIKACKKLKDWKATDAFPFEFRLQKGQNATMYFRVAERLTWNDFPNYKEKPQLQPIERQQADIKYYL